MESYQKLRASILKRLQKELKPSRYRHTLGVETTAIALARIHGISEESASIAALLHDVAKYVPKDTMMLYLQETPILQRFPDLDQYPKLLHAFAGAEIVQHDYPELDPDIVNSVRYHTTGREHMCDLEKIIFAADYIEPGRELFPGLIEARSATFDNLDLGVLLILEQTIAYLTDQESEIFPLTQEAYNYQRKYTANILVK